MKKILLGILALGATYFASAQQTAERALLYANQNFYGTARSSAMGGAFSSLGGDISVASTNPAGLAIFRNSTVSLTPGLHFSKIGGNGFSGDESKFIFPSAGIVFVTENKATGVKNWNFGITYNQGANYNATEEFKNLDSNYSLLDDIADDANYDASGDFKPYKEDALRDYDKYSDVGLLPGMGYNTYLISPTGNNGAYQSVLASGELMNRFSKLETKGSSGEIGFSVAGNYQDKLYFGATLGIQNINLESTDKYDEQTAENPTFLDSFYYDQYLETRGAGINLKLGLIYRPTDELRLAFAAHTPTFYSLEDEYFYSMGSEFVAEPEKGKGLSFKQNYPTNGETGVFEYEYQTPWKFTFGGSYIFDKIGLLSVDYELIDYSSAKFSADDANFDAVNQEIENLYKLTGNLKVGAEVRLDKQFALRAGYNHFGNMFEDDSNMEQKASQYSAGLGYRFKNMFLDASYQFYTQEVTKGDDYKHNLDVNTVKLTFGYKF